MSTIPDPDGSILAAAPLAVWQLDRLDRFERISRLAARLFDVPMAWIVDEAEESVHRFVQAVGLSVAGRRPGREPERRKRQARSKGWAPADCGLRFLARHVLVDATGHRLGTLVLADRRARQFDPASRQALDDLARTVEVELRVTRRGSIDGLTGLYNRAGFEQLAGAALELCQRAGRPASVLYFDLDGFKQINDSQGHDEGDRALAGFAGLLRRSFRSCDLVARLGGDEFAVLAGADRSRGPHPGLQRLDAAVAGYNAQAGRTHRLAFSVGLSAVGAGRGQGLQAMLAHADLAMYADKREHRSRRVRALGHEAAAAGGTAVDVIAAEGAQRPRLSDARPCIEPSSVPHGHG